MYRMSNFTFTVSQVQGEHGHSFPLLTANEYPWMNVQIVPTPPHQRDIIMDALRRRGGRVCMAEGRQDFVAIQSGGGSKEHPTIEVTAENYREVADALLACQQAAADFWAENSEYLGEILR